MDELSFEIIDEEETSFTRSRTRKQEEYRRRWISLGIITLVTTVISVSIYFAFFKSSEMVRVMGIVEETKFLYKGTHVSYNIDYSYHYKGETYYHSEVHSSSSSIKEGTNVWVLLPKDNPDKGKLQSK